MMKIKLLLVCTFALLFSACAAPTVAQPVETETVLPISETSPTQVASPLPTSETLPTSEPTQPPAQVEASPTTSNPLTMTTYTDDFAGFSLDYPANWFLESSALAHAEESIGYNISVATWDVTHAPAPTDKNPNNLPAGGTKIDVGVMKQPLTLEEAVTQLSEVDGPILARKDITLAGGLPAVILDFEGFAGLTRTLITILNENVIYVTGYGKLEPFEAIALSLRAK
jgi:hypothetical protein